MKQPLDLEKLIELSKIAADREATLIDRNDYYNALIDNGYELIHLARFAQEHADRAKKYWVTATNLEADMLLAKRTSEMDAKLIRILQEKLKDARERTEEYRKRVDSDTEHISYLTDELSRATKTLSQRVTGPTVVSNPAWEMVRSSVKSKLPDLDAALENVRAGTEEPVFAKPLSAFQKEARRVIDDFTVADLKTNPPASAWANFLKPTPCGTPTTATGSHTGPTDREPDCEACDALQPPVGSAIRITELAPWTNSDCPLKVGMVMTVAEDVSRPKPKDGFVWVQGSPYPLVGGLWGWVKWVLADDRHGPTKEPTPERKGSNAAPLIGQLVRIVEALNDIGRLRVGDVIRVGRVFMPEDKCWKKGGFDNFVWLNTGPADHALPGHNHGWVRWEPAEEPRLRVGGKINPGLCTPEEIGKEDRQKTPFVFGPLNVHHVPGPQPDLAALNKRIREQRKQLRQANRAIRLLKLENDSLKFRTQQQEVTIIDSRSYPGLGSTVQWMRTDGDDS